MELYFPFLDGALSYDCVTCGARCCHGLGFGVGRSELVPLLAKRPQLAPFLQPQGSHAVALDFSDEGCWFLRGDGRCGVEVEDGRAAKPGVCRLFPFNRLHQIGEVLVVEPHLTSCPLDDASGRGVSWREIEAEIVAGGGELPLMTPQVPSGLSDGWRAREEAVRDQTAALLDAGDPMALARAQAPAEGERLAALRASWHRSLGLDAAAVDAAERGCTRPLALLAPTFRFATLFGIGGGPYPRIAGRLAALLLAQSLFAALAARALGKPPRLRSLGELFRATALERELLARWDRPAGLAQAPRPCDLPAPADRAFARWVELLAEGAPSLGGAFDQAAGELDPSLRPLVLRALSDRYGALRLS